ncbi:MAG: sigma-70 family RNA polymerase sigma factor [Planctomycetota bacterium]|nr:sigma-70 family RNA polymerase sigma factor [Planctomycetota bacterium]
MPTTAMMIEALVAMRHEPGGVPAEHFWQLVERFRADLVNQSVAILGSSEDAEDVAQESLCLAFRALPTLKDPRKLGTWLRTINRNNALMILRRRRMDPLRGGAAIDSQVAAPITTPTGSNLEQVGREQTVEQVARAVDSLPEPFREVVVLRYWEGMSNDHIAVRLGVPEGTVKSRLARADRILHERLRRLWSQEGA